MNITSKISFLGLEMNFAEAMRKLITRKPIIVIYQMIHFQSMWLISKTLEVKLVRVLSLL